MMKSESSMKIISKIYRYKLFGRLKQLKLQIVYHHINQYEKIQLNPELVIAEGY